MRVFMALVRRELAGAFNALTGWVVMAATALLTGISIVDMVTKLSDRPTDSPVTELFYQSAYFWVILLVVSPVITMRTFAAEKSSGTYEALMTTPVGDWQVVLAKYTGSMLFFGLVWLPLLGVLLILRQVTGEAGLLDPGATAGAFLGVMLIGSVYMALGCFASSMTRSQIIAAMVSFLLGIGLWIVSLRPVSTNVGDGRWVRLLDEFSLLRHMDDFARGILDSRHVVFHVTVTFLFLFLTQRVVESRRWK